MSLANISEQLLHRVQRGEKVLRMFPAEEMVGM
jgi:hypothetical protein